MGDLPYHAPYLRWQGWAETHSAHVNPYIVVIQCDGHESENRAKLYLDTQVQRCVVKSKTAQRDAVELNMEIRLKNDNTDFINVLSEMEGVRSAVLVSYNGDYMG